MSKVISRRKFLRYLNNAGISYFVLHCINPKAYAQIGLPVGYWHGTFFPWNATMVIAKAAARSPVAFEWQATQVVAKALAGWPVVFEWQATQVVAKVAAR